MEQANFEIGIITKPQGIKGELRVLPTTDDPGRFELLIGETVYIKKANKDAPSHATDNRDTLSSMPVQDKTGLENIRPVVLTAARVQKGMVYIKLKGINDRNDAEKFGGAIITIPPQMALPLEDNEYYVRDLIGLLAVNESEEHLGVLARVVHTSANDIYEIKPQEGKPFLVPAVKEFVKSVDLKDGKIVLSLIEGLANEGIS